MLATLLCCLLLSPAVLAAGMYKWVDEHGRVHYGDRPPPGSEHREMRAPPPPSGDPGLRSERAQRRDRLLRAYEHERESEARADAQLAQDRAVRCQEARDRVRLLDRAEGYPMYRKGPGGEREFISDPERERMRALWEDRVRDYCE